MFWSHFHDYLSHITLDHQLLEEKAEVYHVKHRALHTLVAE